jgi:hypothetical protein
MKLSLPNSPAKLTLIALFGGLMTAAPLLTLLSLRTHHLSSAASLAWFLFAFLVPMALGFYLAFRAEGDLRNGIAAERWTTTQLTPIRRIFGSRHIIGVGLGLIAVGIILLLMNPRHSEVVWPFILLSQSLTRIFGALKEPRPSTPPPDWRNFTPIHSDQWGQR